MTLCNIRRTEPQIFSLSPDFQSVTHKTIFKFVSVFTVYLYTKFYIPNKERILRIVIILKAKERCWK
jgi:hypothetical protein